MKVTRELVLRSALKLLNEAGLEELTLRGLAKELTIQAATVYWHFENKQELIDEMATLVLAEGKDSLVPKKQEAEWPVWVTAFGSGLRQNLLACRDGARLVAGSRLTNTRFMETTEAIGARLVDSGFTVRQAVVLLSTIYNYTLSFVMEEQAVYPRPGMRSPLYDLSARNTQLSGKELPIMRQAGQILFDRFDRRYREGLDLIIGGARHKLE